MDSMDVTGWSLGEVAAVTAKLDDDSVWWVRIENDLYSPAFAPKSTRDTAPEHYTISVGAESPNDGSWRVLAKSHGYSILYNADGNFSRSASFDPNADYNCRFHLSQFIPIRSGFQVVVPADGFAAPRGGTGITDPQVQALVDLVDDDRYYNTIAQLVSYNSRNTFSASVDDARDWLATEMMNLGLTVTTPSFSVFGTTAYNVVGVIEGTTYPEEVLVIGGHYDSVPSSGAAPGAEDNASGAAGVIESARVLSTMDSQRTLVFICFGGEEQGLYGSADYVSDMTATERSNFQAALTMDMISYTADAEMDVLLETDSLSSPLVIEMAAAAADFTDLVVYFSDNPFGSDHMPFINANLDSVLAIENDWDVYPDYHRSTDTLSNITRELGADIVRMNVATIARMANPDPVNSGMGEGWTLF